MASPPLPISTLFETGPRQFGVRGDVYLWRDMAERLSTVPCPATADELEAILAGEFEQLTGHPLSHDDYIRMDRYNHGGMGGGLVSPKWWRERLIPLLRERLAAARNDQTDRRSPA